MEFGHDLSELCLWGGKSTMYFLYSSGFTSHLKEYFFPVSFQSSFLLPNSYPSLSYFYSLCKDSKFFQLRCWIKKLFTQVWKSSIEFYYSKHRPKHAEVIAILPYTQWKVSVYISCILCNIFLYLCLQVFIILCIYSSDNVLYIVNHLKQISQSDNLLHIQSCFYFCRNASLVVESKPTSCFCSTCKEILLLKQYSKNWHCLPWFKSVKSNFHKFV